MQLKLCIANEAMYAIEQIKFQLVTGFQALKTGISFNDRLPCISLHAKLRQAAQLNNGSTPHQLSHLIK